MNALVRKEFRLLLPTWIAALLLAVAPAGLIWMFSPQLSANEEVFTMIFAVAAMLMPLAAFGQEFSTGTFSLLLSQPVPRLRLWRVKVGMLAIGMLSVWVAMAFSCASYGPALAVAIRGSAFISLVCFAGGLWTTLLFRQIAAAFWFTLLVPLAILASTALLLERHPDALESAVGTLLALYSVAGFLWARRMFLQAQDTQWTGGAISIPAWLSFGTRARPPSATRRHRPLRALWKKEFQLHQVSLLIAGLLCVLHLAVKGIQKMELDPADPNEFLAEVLGFWWVLWLALPFVIGGMAVAEERKQGTLESQLCLPARRRSQAAVKIVTAVLLGVFLGGVMPSVLELVGMLAGVPSQFFGREEEEFWLRVLAICGASAGITLVSFYASTLARSLLQSLGIAVGIGIGLICFMVWAVSGARIGLGAPFYDGPLIVFAGPPVLIVTVLVLSFKNCSILVPGRYHWYRNSVMLVVSMVLIVTTTALAYNRIWEAVIPLEPTHGPACLTGAIRPRICFAGVKTFVLLPDGRLWATRNSRVQEINQMIDTSRNGEQPHPEKIRMPVPADGVFLGQSNWVGLVSCLNPFSQETNLWAGLRALGLNWGGHVSEVVGLQANGTLWQVFTQTSTNFSTVPQPVRIGTDSDWQTIAAGSSHFLALKHDGTLWGWGGNFNGQLGPGRQVFNNGPVRIGTDSDWTAIYAAQNTSIGVKRDGTVWKWGYLPPSPDSQTTFGKPEDHPEPVRWYRDGSDWADIESNINYDLMLKRDGTLWGSGWIPFILLDRDVDDWERHRRFTGNPSRLGSDSDWSDISLDRGLVALKRNGNIFQSPLWLGGLTVYWGSGWRPSRYSDWIAVKSRRDGMFVALAADGTLSSWGDPQEQHNGYAGLLGPSQKPLWSVNILAVAKAGDGTVENPNGRAK